MSYHDTQAAVEYLQAANILKLQTAARFAGLKFRNGDSGFNKQGIIEKLQTYPAMLVATVAALKRMETGDFRPSGRTLPSGGGFADDILDEQSPTEPDPRGATPNPEDQDPTIPAVPPALITGLSRRVETLEGYAISRETAATIAQQCQKPLTDSLLTLSARVKELETRKPIELKMPDRAPITIPTGAHKSYPKLLQYLEINRRVILTGSAGTGKSMAVKNASEHFGLAFYLQTPVTMSHEYLGHRDAQGNFHETPTFQAYTKGGLLLWDEADAGLPDAMLAANPIFDGNGFATFGDGNIYKQHPDFMAVFNMNTDGNGATMQYAGRNRLDGATLARFGVRIHWEIDDTIEGSMAGAHRDWHRVVKAVRQLMEQRGIVDVNATPRHVKTGAALLSGSAGISRAEILKDVLHSGALAEVWNDVLRLPEVSSFLRG